MNSRYPLAALGLALAVSASAAPSAEDLARCAAMSAADQRLACYDALSRPAAAVAPRPAPPAAANPPATGAAPAPATAAAPPPPAKAVSAPAPAGGTAGDVGAFGFSKAQQHVAVDEGPAQMRARITRITEDQQRMTWVEFDNGQVWEIYDSNVFARAGDEVTIQRGALNSFTLLTPTRRSYRIWRKK